MLWSGLRTLRHRIIIAYSSLAGGYDAFNRTDRFRFCSSHNIVCGASHGTAYGWWRLSWRHDGWRLPWRHDGARLPQRLLPARLPRSLLPWSRLPGARLGVGLGLGSAGRLVGLGSWLGLGRAGLGW